MSYEKRPSKIVLVIACALGFAACNSEERLLQPPHSSTVTGPTISRGGIEGLKQDIASARSLPQDTKIGTPTGVISRDEFVSGLEAQLRQMLVQSGSPTHDLVPSFRRFDVSPGDVGGSGAMYGTGTDAQGYRWAKDWAYTQCNQGSGVVAKIELSAAWYRWDNGQLIGPWIMWSPTNSAPNYASNSAEQGIQGDTVRAQAHNKHTCEIGDPQDYPYKYSDPFVVI